MTISAKARVLECIVAGISDRTTIAEQCGITYMQCMSAMRHLQHEGKIVKATPQVFQGNKGGSKPATYRATGYEAPSFSACASGVNFVFNLGDTLLQ